MPLPEEAGGTTIGIGVIGRGTGAEGIVGAGVGRDTGMDICGAGCIDGIEDGCTGRGYGATGIAGAGFGIGATETGTGAIGVIFFCTSMPTGACPDRNLLMSSDIVRKELLISCGPCGAGATGFGGMAGAGDGRGVGAMGIAGAGFGIGAGAAGMVGRAG